MNQKQILCVEDEAAIILPLRYALEREGWNVSWANTGAQALQYLSEQAFDFILLDAERDAYVQYWQYLPQLLKSSGICIVDNVLSHADQVVEFKEMVASDPSFLTTTLAIGAGLMCIVKL